MMQCFMRDRAARAAGARRWTSGGLGAALVAVMLALGPLLAGAQPLADPPGRVGRIARADGPVQLVQAAATPDGPATVDNLRGSLRNWPVTSGDVLVVGENGRAELSVGSTQIRLGARSRLAVLQLDDEALRLQLQEGNLALRVRTLENAGNTAVQAGDLWLRPLGPGLFRVDASPRLLAATAWRESLQVVGPNSEFTLRSGQRLQFDPQGRQWRTTEPQRDRFASWAMSDDALAGAPAEISPEMTGAEDLARYGEWQISDEWGPVWLPQQVAPDWAPYQQGNWAWVAPWGWTWVDAAPWGFAPFHYGRWVRWHQRWCWAPGRYEPHPVYAPALVGWAGSAHGRPDVAPGAGRPQGGPPAWFPLAPRDPYVPPFRATDTYWQRVNRPHLPDNNRHEPWAAAPRVNPAPVREDERRRIPTPPAHETRSEVVPPAGPLRGFGNGTSGLPVDNPPQPRAGGATPWRGAENRPPAAAPAARPPVAPATPPAPPVTPRAPQVMTPQVVTPQIVVPAPTLRMPGPPPQQQQPVAQRPVEEFHRRIPEPIRPPAMPAAMPSPPPIAPAAPAVVVVPPAVPPPPPARREEHRDIQPVRPFGEERHIQR